MWFFGRGITWFLWGLDRFKTLGRWWGCLRMETSKKTWKKKLALCQRRKCVESHRSINFNPKTLSMESQRRWASFFFIHQNSYKRGFFPILNNSTSNKQIKMEEVLRKGCKRNGWGDAGSMFYCFVDVALVGGWRDCVAWIVNLLTSYVLWNVVVQVLIPIEPPLA